MNGPLSLRSRKFSTVRCWCSRTLRPVLSSMKGSHIQSIGAAHSSRPTSPEKRWTSSAYWSTVTDQAPLLCNSVKPPESSAHGAAAFGSTL
jgi:hypothetical protein